MITAPETFGLVLTHDDARALLTYAVPGARVAFERKSARSCGYEIAVRRFGAPTLCVRGMYTIPAIADRLAANAREQVEREMRR
ncbi:MAG TPA: hypothetical protein VIU16_14330 [Gaiellaceae bacterium]